MTVTQFPDILKKPIVHIANRKGLFKLLHNMFRLLPVSSADTEKRATGISFHLA
jgi:hypothetical protein